MNVRAIIIEDEKRSQDTLLNLLRRYCEFIEVVDVADSVDDGIEKINRLKPDLIFLDIELKNGTGFQILDQVKHKKMAIIFTTAYEEYALRAFKYASIDYLLKPISIDALKAATNKYQNWFAQEEYIDERIELLKSSFLQQPTKLAIPTVDGYKLINLVEIVYLQGERNYTKIFLESSKFFLSSKTLKYYEELLDHRFFRISKSNIINLDYVTEIKRSKKPVVHLSTSKHLNVSPAKTKMLLAKIVHS